MTKEQIAQTMMEWYDLEVQGLYDQTLKIIHQYTKDRDMAVDLVVLKAAAVIYYYTRSNEYGLDPTWLGSLVSD